MHPIFGLIIATVIAVPVSLLIVLGLYAASFYPACVHLTYSVC